MASSRPDGYINPTGMAHSRSAHPVASPQAPLVPDGGHRPAADAEQDAKRIEKIRPHASSHHAAGTVTLDT